MNRFRTKKKAKEPTEGFVRASTDSDVPRAAPSPFKSSKTFRRGKKNQVSKPKVEIDLSTALPSSDDFRTSLLMSGLSARFSMLREQDDPKSKIGKASDDSVLFPKRQSRLNDFGFSSRGLSDIAEVSSINGSIRPQFAYGRTDSYVDGYGTDDDSTHGGSIMNRSKPVEGNNLFGGRQKIYKIPVDLTGSTKSLTDGGGGGMGGRVFYENDISQSAFQKLREREREQQRHDREEEEQNAHFLRAESPPLSGYNRNRETSSTTSSAGPFSIARTSTAATSVTSQRTPSLSGSHTPITSGALGLERILTKGRRLYENGLDQHLHEQQYLAMNRIDTLTRQRIFGGLTPPPGLSSPTGMRPVDRWDRQQIPGKTSLPNMRAASPVLNAPSLGAFDFGPISNNVAETKPSFGLASPPLSPSMSESEDHQTLAVQPNDRGKATASGAFSKPAQPYNDNKYTQRQLQMQQGRETPPLRKTSPPRAFSSRQQQQQPTGRTRADSTATFASGRSRSSSSAQRQFLPQDRIAEVVWPEPQAKGPNPQPLSSETVLVSPKGNPLASRDDVEQVAKSKHPFLFPSQIYRQNQPQAVERPPESQHPANRQRPLPPDSSSPLNGGHDSPAQGFRSVSTVNDVSVAPVAPSSADSPTLGPTTGLNGMVRQHLRSDSNTSSMYGGIPSAGLLTRFPCDPNEPLPQHEYTLRSNHWDTDDWDQASHDEYKFASEGAVDRTRVGNIIPSPLSVRSVNVKDAGQEPSNSLWERDLETHHTRHGSSETQKERQDFKAELAARRQLVQENLKSFHEIESGSASPAPIPDPSKDGPVKSPVMGLLKAKSSRGSLVGRSMEAGQSKAMKILGIGNTTSGSDPSLRNGHGDEIAWQEEEEEMLQGLPNGHTIPPQTKAFRQARRDAQRDRERQMASRHQRKLASETYDKDAERRNQHIEGQPQRYEETRDRVPPNIRTGRTPSQERGPPPVTQNHRKGSSQESKGSIGNNRSASIPPSRTSRDRSNSDASSHSKSRNGRYRDDLAKAMAEGVGSSSQVAYDELEPRSARLIPKSSGPLSIATQASATVPFPLIGSNPATRSRSNSKATVTGNFDSQVFQPLKTDDGMDIGLSPRPSPVTPYSVNSTPSLSHPSPTGSAPNTPITNQGFPLQGHTSGARKRSINKSEISEPKFVSSTSRIPTVNLAPGTSLQRGIDAPPIPLVNPRRRQTRAMFGFGKKEEPEDLQSLPAATQSTEDMSTFSADEGDSKSKLRQRLRKSSSEGGNLHVRARQAAIAVQSPALPSGFQGNGSLPQIYDGGMF